MKIDKQLKRYYSARTARISLPDFPGAIINIKSRGSWYPYRQGIASAALHVALAMIIILGFTGMGKETPLSRSINRYAQQVDLENNLEQAINTLGENFSKRGK